MPDPTSDPLDTTVATSTTDFSSLGQQISDASRAGAMLGKTLTSVFDQLVVKGRSVGDAFNSIALSLSNAALKAAFQPLQQSFTGLFTGLLNGSSTPFAHGGMLQSGTPIPFANGGIIAAPMNFPLAGGRSAIAGERGAEAILPLSRGADGRLGVAAQASAAPATIVVNIAATDVDSFRRSETQIAALLSRAVAQGNRNL